MSAHTCPFETFPALAGLPVIHAFTGKVPGLDVKIDRTAALERLHAAHDRLRSFLGIGTRHFVTAEQVHGSGVAVVSAKTRGPVPAVDALITDDPAVCLGIYVADCGPIWLVDPIRRAIGCVHSGRKGTDFGIVAETVKSMIDSFGCDPSRMVAQLGPCIRPPHYEVDFAAAILLQCKAAGIAEVHDSGTCTATANDRYYSYRLEKGRTGRMAALLALA